jgi:hypothetical protein
MIIKNLFNLFLLIFDLRMISFLWCATEVTRVAFVGKMINIL